MLIVECAGGGEESIDGFSMCGAPGALGTSELAIRRCDGLYVGRDVLDACALGHRILMSINAAPVSIDIMSASWRWRPRALAPGRSSRRQVVE